MFLNLKHGEKFSYDNYCSKIQCYNLVNENIGLHILFGCVLESHSSDAEICFA